jgi:arylamine N-acetyltransferase
MRTAAMTIMLCLALGSCAPATTTGLRVDLAEETTLSDAYVNCLIRAAIRLDDHKSDPSVVAQAILSVCTDERRALQDLYARGMSDDAQTIYRERIHNHPELDLDAATAIVSHERENPTP